MKNKIIVSLLLIFLLAISVSAVSANDDLSDAISETSDVEEDIELTNTDMENAEIISEIDTENSIEDTEINENIEDTKLGNFYEGSQNVTVQDLEKFETYVGTGKTYGDGTIFILKDGISFNLTHAQNLKISCTIQGGTITGPIDNFFTVESPANGGPSSITIRNTKFILRNPNQNILLVKGMTQGINGVLNVAGVTLENITIADNEVEGATLLNIECDQTTTIISNAINITNNTLNGAIALKFNGIQMTHDGLDGEEIYIPATEIIIPKNTRIILNSNVIQYAVDTSVGDSPFNFQLKLIDEDGNALVNKTINYALNQKEYTAVTDERGIATLKVSLSKSGTYDIFSRFLGDIKFIGSQMVANTITIYKKESVLTVKNVAYKVSATKKLSATFKDDKGKLIKNKKVTFTVNGKSYTATTNSKGVATVKISLNKKGKYTYKAKFAGDGTYKAVTKSATLTINPLASSLTLKKYTYKKSSKSKKLKATLKSGTKVLKNKKVSFKVNGKTYSAKTNSKGIATVKIKLTKKGTFKYTAKFAGDNVYKAISKSNKVVIK